MLLIVQTELVFFDPNISTRHFMKGARHGTGIKTPDFSSNNDLKLAFRN